MFRHAACSASARSPPGNLAGLLASIGRGGLQFMLIIWLQGIWLPLHGYSFESTPLWAGIYLLPLTVGFLVAGPVSGCAVRPVRRARVRHRRAADRRGHASSGCCCCRSTSRTGRSRSLIAAQRHRLGPVRRAEHDGDHEQRAGRASAARRPGMRGTFFNAGSSLSIGVFFSLMIVGLAATLPTDAVQRPERAGRPRRGRRSRSGNCRRSAACSPRSSATTRSPSCSARPAPCSTLPHAAGRDADRQASSSRS